MSAIRADQVKAPLPSLYLTFSEGPLNSPFQFRKWTLKVGPYKRGSTTPTQRLQLLYIVVLMLFKSTISYLASHALMMMAIAHPQPPPIPYGPDWQPYYLIDDGWPNVTFPMPEAYAGSVSVSRGIHVNNTLFYVAFTKENSSLSAKAGHRADEPWVIWLNGGPVTSSLLGLFEENGPIRYTGTSDRPATLSPNPYSWHRLADIFYVDQPVGAGYSTVDTDGWAADENMVATDFLKFLTNLVAIFPSLKKRPLYLTGESYAGMYIPYISRAIFQTSTPPVNLAKIAIGDGTMSTPFVNQEYSTLQILQTYPQLIGFNTTVYEYFVEQYNLCGYNRTLQYPPSSPYPPMRNTVTFNTSSALARRSHPEDARTELNALLRLYNLTSDDDEIRVDGRRFVRRQNTGGPFRNFALTGEINPAFQCGIWSSMTTYAALYTAPWKEQALDTSRAGNALFPPVPKNAGAYLNDPAVRKTLHAPNKTWNENTFYHFNTTVSGVDPSQKTTEFLSELSKNVSIVFYSGNDDMVTGYRGTELVIQNMTFGGIQGFTVKPITPFSDLEGKFAGIVHQERNVTFALFDKAGRMVPRDQPKAAYAFVREFILGNNRTGLVTSGPQGTSLVGGVYTPYSRGILTATEVYTGSYRTEGTITWPKETWASWESYMATRTEQDVSVPNATQN